MLNVNNYHSMQPQIVHRAAIAFVPLNQSFSFAPTHASLIVERLTYKSLSISFFVSYLYLCLSISLFRLILYNERMFHQPLSLSHARLYASLYIVCLFELCMKPENVLAFLFFRQLILVSTVERTQIHKYWAKTFEISEIV